MPQYTWSAKIRSTLMKHAEGVSSHHILHSQHTVQNAFASGNVDYSLENIYLGLGLFFDSFVSINRPGQVCNGYLWVVGWSKHILYPETLEKNCSNTEAWLWYFWMVTKGPTAVMQKYNPTEIYMRIRFNLKTILKSKLHLSSAHWYPQVTKTWVLEFHRKILLHYSTLLVLQKHSAAVTWNARQLPYQHDPR